MSLLTCAATAQAATPIDARAFVDTIGVNTHIYYTDTVYANFAMLKQRLQEMGMRHVRDGFDPAHRQFFYDRVDSLGGAGIKSTLISCRLISTGWDGLDADVADAKNKIRSSLEGIEGTNEPNLTGYADWASRTRDCQHRLHRLAKGNTAGAALTQPIYEPSVTGDRYDELGSMADRADGGNMHPYPGDEKPSGPAYYPFARALSESRQFGFAGKAVPVIATETGYHNALAHSGGHRPVSEKAAGIYMPRLFLEYAKGGVARTFAYELVDLFPDAALTDEQRHFGLFRNDWSYKPAAIAVKNLIGFLDGPTASARAPLGYTLTNTADPDGSGPRGAVKDMLLQRSDGSWWLALWQDSSVWNGATQTDVDNPAATVGVTLDRTVSPVEGYRPTYGSGSYGAVTNVRSFSANVDDDVALLRIAP